MCAHRVTFAFAVSETVERRVRTEAAKFPLVEAENSFGGRKAGLWLRLEVAVPRGGASAL